MANVSLSTIIFLIFMVLLLIGATFTTARWVRYQRLGIRPPRLLIRDTALLLGLAIPLAAIAAVRVLGWTQFVSGPDGPYWWWLIATGGLPIVGLAIYDYYELFVVERNEGE